jgi:hypothetical protein
MNRITREISMRKKIATRCHLIIAFTIVLTAFGCKELTEKISSGQLPAIPSECTKSSNYHKKVLDGIYRMGQVSKMQLRRAEDQLFTCLKDTGLSRQEALGMIKKQDEEYREKVEKEGVKSGSDMFVF